MTLEAVIQQLQLLEDAGRDGALTLPDGVLEVTNPKKVFWPASGLTKGDLLRYYARVSPWLLPVIADRPLVMKRYPNGVLGKAFYQQRAPDAVPAGVNVQVVEGDEDDDGPMPRLIGGSLLTLLYVAQLGAISLDPWFSRAASPAAADFVAIDLDPMPGVPFAQVRDVARWVREALVMLDVPGGAQDVGVVGPAHLHPAGGGHVVRVRPAAVPDHRHRGRLAASQGRDRGAGGRQARTHRLRGLPAEHRGQDTGLRVQRTREPVCRRLHAVAVG